MFRFLAILSLGLWLGAILFFGAILAPTVFSVLPSRAMAGSVVAPSLSKLHIIGFACGAIFLGSYFASLASQRSLTRNAMLPLALVVLMSLLTCAAEYGIGRKMNRLRAEMGTIDQVAPTDPRRVEFNSLHVWSTRFEGAVFFLGLGALFLVTRRLP